MDKATKKPGALQERGLVPAGREMFAVFTMRRSEILAAVENLHRVATALGSRSP